MAAQARLSLHLSKCHTVGNHMSRLICSSILFVVALLSYFYISFNELFYSLQLYHVFCVCAT